MPTRNLNTNARRIDKQLEFIDKFVTNELARSYGSALDDIRATLSRMYEQYGVTGEFTRAQSTQFLRLSNIEQQIVDIMRPYVQQSEELIKEASKYSFDQSYFRHAWAVDQAAGAGLGWGMVSDEAVRAATGIGGDLAELEGILTKSEVDQHAKILNNAFTNYDKDTQKWISREVRDGIIKGNSVQDLAKRLDKNALIHSRNSAERIARTETLRARGIGGQATYEQAADKGVQVRQVWDATLDSRTRPDHAAADGTVMDNETQLFSVPWGDVPGPRRSGIAAQDINCRCISVGEVEGYAPSVRRQREQGIRPYQTFGTWAQSEGITTNRYGQQYNFE